MIHIPCFPPILNFLIATLRIQIQTLLSHVGDWTFNMFELAEATNNRPLSILGFFVLKTSGITDCLMLDETKMARWGCQLCLVSLLHFSC